MSVYLGTEQVSQPSGLSSASSGTDNYENLYNKPKINSVELVGDVDSDSLNVQRKGDYAERTELPEAMTNSDIENILQLGGL